MGVAVHREFVDKKYSSYYIIWGLCEPVITNMARLDYFYIDNDFAKYSRFRLEGYHTFTENIQRRYPGYMLDLKTNRIVSSTDRKVNLDDLLALFRSKDLAKYEREKDTFFGPSGRYTTENAQEQMSVLYTTYPRSGNSMMRKYFENITGVATGSDMNLKHAPNVALQYTVSKAEGQMGDQTWFKKSHFPMTLPFQPKTEHDITLICSRYELDCEVSFFYLVFTQTHGLPFNNDLLKNPNIRPYW